MRVWIVLALILTVGCRSRIPREDGRNGEVYGGVGVAALPDIGVALTAGQMLSRGGNYDYAFEMRASLQGGDDTPTQDGEFFQIQAAVKQSASPGHSRRMFFRYGVTWLRANGDPNILDQRGDYFGAFGSVGYDWDLSPRWTFSPEVQLTLVDGEGSIGTEVLPQLFFNLLYHF